MSRFIAPAALLAGLGLLAWPGAPEAADRPVPAKSDAQKIVYLDDQGPLLIELRLRINGKSFRSDLIHPDGREQMLLSVPRYDFNWQHRYLLTDPLRIPAGSQIRHMPDETP